MTLCYLGLGSNLKTPQRQMRQAIRGIQSLPRTNLLKISSFYTTKPLGARFQPPYCNAVVEIDTTLQPLALLKACQNIETAQLRVKKQHWGPRTIDIDILLYGARQINSPKLQIPHQELWHRDFVLMPLSELKTLLR